MKEDTIKNPEINPAQAATKKDDEGYIKPGGLTDGMMKDETKTVIHNQKVSEDPSTVNDILPEETEEDISPAQAAAKQDDLNRPHKDADRKPGDIKPGGLTDGMMRDETKTEIRNQKVIEDPEAVNILPEDPEEK